ncbi:hypothetical protein P154DRAFT_541778 [Amniculicola lignicola CBS 123094]|uniref:RNA polymerase II degradation factor 1 n=1 Tax=Amniculicola lignicola CBS 123094 TaxID=1392246 RepID=A0A6A5X0M8_9PLEO|nr:hypothetical protein P154DRAFT_541778 [Amniculicola lignicola CBS 123094]
MSEIQSRPAPRGRSSARGGRGGFGTRGPRSSKQNGDHTSASAVDTSADQGELGELKRRYQPQLTTLKELFPDWTDVDLVVAIEESDGDLQATIEKISEGNVSQFAEVKKTKDRSRSKVKEAGAPAEANASLRGGRDRPQRGTDSVRGGRGRGTDRGRGGFRGARGGPTNAWGDAAAPLHPKANGEATPAEPPAEKVPEPEAPKTKTWASIFAAPKPAPAPPKPAAKPPAAKEEPAPAPAETPAHDIAQETVAEAEELPAPSAPVDLTPDEKVEKPGPEPDFAPVTTELTKDNVEHLPDDTANPPLTETVATPLNASQAPISRPALGGFQTSALKATGSGHRSASFQRKILEQQEAVFGSLGLNGELDPDALDVDEDREEAETRTQPPQHSPVAQPRAALPPAPRQPAPPAEVQPPTQDATPAPKGAPGLPPVPQHQQPLGQHSPPNPLAPQAMQSQGSQGAQQQYNQFGRYGQGGIQSESTASQQKSYDPFGHQIPQPNQYDYPNQQTQNAGQQQPQSQAGAFSSAPDNFGSQYLTAEQQRSAYQNYYQNYNQQGAQSQQEAGSAQQRTGSAFGTGPSDSNFPTSQQQQVSNSTLRMLFKVLSNMNQSQSRYNEAQNSGHTTPNPALGGQQPTGPASQGQHMQQPHAQPGQHAGGYPYNHPYYTSPYYTSYVNQFGSYGQGGYGGFGGKGMYGPSHHYGMSPQASYEQHSSSPANSGGFGQSSMHRDSSLGGGLGEYAGRSVSSTSQNQHSATAAAGGFGGFPDSLGRSQGYPNQNSSYGQQQSGQQGEESLKPFGDAKSGGPSPSALGAQPGRPGSATNTPGQSNQGLPPQSHQQGFGGYPSHLNQQLQGGQGGNQYGSLGGLGGQHQGGGSHQQQQPQQQQTGGYGAGYGGFGGGYGGSYNRGGWGTNYGGQH